MEQVAAFKPLADVAGAHHERLDGRGYHRGLNSAQIPWAAKILVVADVFEAMSANRPYRNAMSQEKIYEIMDFETGQGLDADCVDALVRWNNQAQLESRVDDQLREVDRLLAEL